MREGLRAVWMKRRVGEDEKGIGCDEIVKDGKDGFFQW